MNDAAKQVLSNNNLDLSEIDFDEVSLLRGAANDYFDDHPLLEGITENILKSRKRRMQIIGQQYVKYKQTRNKILHSFAKKYPQNRKYVNKRKYSMAFGAKSDDLMNMMGISLSFKDLLLGRIKFSGDLEIIYIDFSAEWKILKPWLK